MKRRLLFLNLVFTIFSFTFANAQTFWAQPGANWIYNIGDGTSFSSTGVVDVHRAGDTLINSIPCDVLTYHYMFMQNWPGGTWQDYYGPNRYTNESNDTVYMFNSITGFFDVLFIENAQAGTSWTSGPDMDNMCDGDTILIDSTETVVINGITLNKIYPEEFIWTSEHPTVFFHLPIYERIGSLTYFGPIPACIVCPSWGPLICYQDSSGFTFSPNPSISCPVGISDPPTSGSDFSIYPVISTESITIEINPVSTLPVELKIINASGAIVEEIKISDTKTEYSIRHLSKGIYYMRKNGMAQGNSGVFIKL